MLLSASSKCLKVGIPLTSTDGLTNDGEWQIRATDLASCHWSTPPPCRLPLSGLWSKISKLTNFTHFLFATRRRINNKALPQFCT